MLEGTVEATIDGETGILDAGRLALVPARAPHAARNVGNCRARILGFFGASTNVGRPARGSAPGPDA